MSSERRNGVALRARAAGPEHRSGCQGPRHPGKRPPARGRRRFPGRLQAACCRIGPPSSRWVAATNLIAALGGRPASGLLATLLVALAGCADVSRGPSPTPRAEPDASPGGAPAGGLSFAEGVHELLLDACARCHSPSGDAASTALLLGGGPSEDYEVVLPLINLSDPAASRLLTKASGQGHGAGAIFVAASREYRLLEDWIREGAPP